MKGNEFCANVGVNAPKRNPSWVAACLAAVLEHNASDTNAANPR